MTVPESPEPAPLPRQRRGLGIMLGIVLVIGVAATVSVLARTGELGAKADAKSVGPAPVVVTVEPVTLRGIDRSVSCVGTLFGRDEVPLGAKVEGRVISIRHDIGDRVKPGELLAEIDPTDYRLAVAEARRALDGELAKLGLKEIPTGPFEVAKLPAVEKAAAQQRNAASRRERFRQLGSQRAASQEERDSIEMEYSVADANYRQAVLEAETTLAAARLRHATLDTAQQKLDDTKVFAPALAGGSGEFVVCQRGVTEGEIVRILPGMSSTLFKLVVDDPLKLVATVPDRSRGDIKLGQSVGLETEAYPGEPFPGTVARINPAIDRASRTFTIEVAVPNKERRLSPGSFCKVTVHTRQAEQARTVPDEAIVAFAGVTKLFVIEDGKARAVPVKLLTPLQPREATQRRPWVEIDGDVKPGQMVATSGLAQLSDGTAVRVRSAPSEPGALATGTGR